jgi:hypothetical protein
MNPTTLLIAEAVKAILGTEIEQSLFDDLIIENMIAQPAQINRKKGWLHSSLLKPGLKPRRYNSK